MTQLPSEEGICRRLRAPSVGTEGSRGLPNREGKILAHQPFMHLFVGFFFNPLTVSHIYLMNFNLSFFSLTSLPLNKPASYFNVLFRFVASEFLA